MKRLILLVVLLVPGLAWAADEVVWTLTEATSTRFADRDVAGPVFKAGTKLVVLVHDGDRLRVRDGDDFGWVKEASTTTMPPPEESTFDPAALRERLKAMGLDPNKLPSGVPVAPGGAAPGGGMPMVPSPVPPTAPPVK
jgi:hypothetical protein